MKKLLISIVFVLCVLGCTKELNEQGKTTWKLNPVITEQVEQATEGTASILTALTPFFPPAGAVGATLLAALGIWRKKIKPNYEKAKTEAELYHTSTKTLVEVIEEIKANQPEVWSKLKPILESNIGQNMENVIRALRGKAPKE